MMEEDSNIECVPLIEFRNEDTSVCQHPIKGVSLYMSRYMKAVGRGLSVFVG